MRIAKRLMTFFLIGVLMVALAENDVSAQKTKKSAGAYSCSSCANYFDCSFADDLNETFFIDKAKYESPTPIGFEAVYSTMIREKRQSRDGSESILGYMVYRVFDQYVSDRMTCAKTAKEMDRLTNLRNIIRSFGINWEKVIHNWFRENAKPGADPEKLFGCVSMVTNNAVEKYKRNPKREVCR